MFTRRTRKIQILGKAGKRQLEQFAKSALIIAEQTCREMEILETKRLQPFYLKCTLQTIALKCFFLYDCLLKFLISL